MSNAFGIITFEGSNIEVAGMHHYRPIAAFSFLGRYRMIDFPISNMSNSGIHHIGVYVKQNPRSLNEHLGTGRHYNIHSKQGKLQLLYMDEQIHSHFYQHDISAFSYNLEWIENATEPYVIIAPSYMVYTMDFHKVLEKHIDSGADITMIYQNVACAKEYFMNCNTLTLTKEKQVQAIRQNQGTHQNQAIFLDTYIMKKELLISLVKKAEHYSSLYTLKDIVNDECQRLTVLAVAHHGYLAAITDFKSYYDANMSLIDYETALSLFCEDWPIYTRTNDSCPTQYYENAQVKKSVVSNGCAIEGTVENSIIGRGCIVAKGAVVKNCVILPGAIIAQDVHIENAVVDKKATIIHVKEVIGKQDAPVYIKRGDVL